VVPAAIALAVAFSSPAIGQRAQIGDVRLDGQFSGAPYTLKLGPQFGGAVYSFRWNGKEFINNFDKGRELQSAVSFDNLGECYNPTEAGSRADSTALHSTSKLIAVTKSSTTISTRSQMAFWLAPGTSSSGCPGGIAARNTTQLSDFVLSKHIQLRAEGIANAIDHSVSFSVPRSYKSALFEALTAYLSPDFSQFWTFDLANSVRKHISDGPGDQKYPLIFSTSDHRFAFGVYSSELPQRVWPERGYGRFSFANIKPPGSPTVKWNCVFREKDIKPGDYSYRCTSIFGTLQDVEKAMMELHRIRGRKVQ
jgi:hypothetical protein